MLGAVPFALLTLLSGIVNGDHNIVGQQPGFARPNSRHSGHRGLAREVLLVDQSISYARQR